MSMFQRLYRVRELTQETEESATASKVAAIVATLTIPTIALMELECDALPTALKAKLVSYLHGFCVPICVAWQVDDLKTRIAASRLVSASIFPENPALFLELFDGMIVAPEAFRNDVNAGRRDGELYSATGRTGTALLEILASDFRGFCNHSKLAPKAL
jgi:hypothetical protein